MPELPEVETVRRVLENALVGRRIVEVEIAHDAIVLKGAPAESVRAALLGRSVESVGRKGKYFWMQFDQAPAVLAHLGMAGWVREIGAHTIRLREHGKVSMEQPDGRPKFLKMALTTEEGRTIVLTDGRRLARIWLKDHPFDDKAVAALGPDWLTEPPSLDALVAKLGKRNAPIKALLLDQSLFAGVGNWIADEVLYHAKIAPHRTGSDLSRKEVEAVRTELGKIIDRAVEVGADSEQFPGDWLFHKRWGGKRGDDRIGGHLIRRDQIGGRTTAWVPSIQK